MREFNTCLERDKQCKLPCPVCWLCILRVWRSFASLNSDTHRCTKSFTIQHECLHPPCGCGFVRVRGRCLGAVGRFPFCCVFSFFLVLFFFLFFSFFPFFSHFLFSLFLFFFRFIILSLWMGTQKVVRKWFVDGPPLLSAPRYWRNMKVVAPFHEPFALLLFLGFETFRKRRVRGRAQGQKKWEALSRHKPQQVDLSCSAAAWRFAVSSGFTFGDNWRTWNVSRSFPCAMHNQLKTEADKGGPSIQLKQSFAMASNGVDTMWFLPSALSVKVMKF